MWYLCAPLLLILSTNGTEIPKREEIEDGYILDRLKCDFAWKNDEYDVPEEPLIHPEVDAKFPGAIMNGDDKERDMGL